MEKSDTIGSTHSKSVTLAFFKFIYNMHDPIIAGHGNLAFIVDQILLCLNTSQCGEMLILPYVQQNLDLRRVPTRTHAHKRHFRNFFKPQIIVFSAVFYEVPHI